MDDQYKHPENKDTNINKDRDKYLYLNAIYRDNYTRKDNSIKISSNKDMKYRDGHDYDYMSLRNILREEMDKPVSEQQAQVVGDALIDLYKALYFEEL